MFKTIAGGVLAATVFLVPAITGIAPTAAHAAACTVSLTVTNPDATMTDATACGVATPAGGNSPTRTGTALNGADPGSLGLNWSHIDRDNGQMEPFGSFMYTDDNSGFWMIDVGSGSYNEFIVTMKGGDPLQDDFLWFLVDTTPGVNTCGPVLSLLGWDLCGTWTMYGRADEEEDSFSTFSSKKKKNDEPKPKDVSHMDLFGANLVPTRLSEPGTLALFAFALAGFVVTQRRRQVH